MYRIHNLTSSIESFANPVFLMLWIVMRIYGFLLKTPFLKNMTILLKIFFMKFMKQNTKENSEENLIYFYTLIDDAVARIMKARRFYLGM